jgi:molecular chaperone DnaK
MAYHLGIDLGTTYTAAAAERSGVVEALTLGNRTASVPSVVYLRDDGEILVGEAATRRATSDPGRVAREFKRRVGDPTPIILGGTPYAAEMLMARLLRWSVDRVQEQQGEPPRAIGLTHPANWGPYKLDLFTQAVRQVDLDAALMLAEPVAAATFYASQRRLEPGSVVAVYDLGGGTFDAAMVRRKHDGFEIIGSPEGMERLGGIDFDEAVFAHVREAVHEGLDRLDPEEPAAQAAVARLRQECIDAKEALSSDTDVSIPVLLPGLQTEVRLTRAEFEAMIRPAISETIVALRRAIRSARVSNDEISAVLLVGGSSRIPLVAQMVGAELGRPIAIDAHPKDAIAFGAAIAVAARRGSATPESVTTVLADTRPPPPTQSPDAMRRAARPAPPPGARPAPPPGAGARPAPPPGGARPAAPRPPAPGQQTARPAPPPTAPPRTGTVPAAPAAAASAAAHAGSPSGPGGPASAAPGGPGVPGTRPAAAGAARMQRPAPPTDAPPAAASPARPAPPSAAPPRSASPSGPAAPPRAAPPSGPTAPPRPQAGPVPSGERPAATPQGPTTGGFRPPSGPQAGPGVHPLAGGSAPATPYGGTPRAGGTPLGGHSSGSYPPAHSGGSLADNKVVWIVLGVVALVALIVILAAASSDGGSGGGSSGEGDTDGTAPSGYTEAVEAEFVGECTPSGGEAMCQCAWDAIVEQIPFEDFAEMDRQIREDPTLATDPEALAGNFPELQEIMTGCVGAT